MTWFLPHNFAEKRPFLEKRMEIIRGMRRFFDDEGFYEVETPILQACPTFDTHIHGFAVEEGEYLRSSPEFDMKKLLVAGVENLYQIGANFRKREHSKLHRPEFTMVEWYRAGADYRVLMQDCHDLLRGLSDTYRFGGHVCDAHGVWDIVTVMEVFERYCGIDLAGCLDDVCAFAAEAERIGVRVVKGDAWDDIFHAVMADKIEPYLGMGAPCILYDYPILMAALSRPKVDDERFAERFEVYVCGVELANAFSELTDAAEQRRRFEVDMAAKQALYGVSYPPDEEFFAALEHGLPECAGIALGVDRLVMLACGVGDIGDVQWCG